MWDSAQHWPPHSHPVDSHLSASIKSGHQVSQGVAARRWSGLVGCTAATHTTNTQCSTTSDCSDTGHIHYILTTYMSAMASTLSSSTELTLHTASTTTADMTALTDKLFTTAALPIITKLRQYVDTVCTAYSTARQQYRQAVTSAKQTQLQLEAERKLHSDTTARYNILKESTEKLQAELSMIVAEFTAQTTQHNQSIEHVKQLQQHNAALQLEKSEALAVYNKHVAAAMAEIKSLKIQVRWLLHSAQWSACITAPTACVCACAHS